MRGRPRRKPHALIGDRGYGFPWIISAIMAMGIEPLLCPRGSEHGSGLGRRGYVAERTLAWFGHCRQVTLCFEKCSEHFQAFHDLAACLLCANKLKRLDGLGNSFLAASRRRARQTDGIVASRHRGIKIAVSGNPRIPPHNQS
ncbi:MAG: hypothetical protein IH888_10300 [Planctomycetes bacterium]|nr:hypothetical protein [Planctomycetota bacterium]